MYQTQITQLEQAYNERQATYQQQIQTLTEQVNAARPHLNDLQLREETLQAQVIELQATRDERLAQYQQQLQQAQAQYGTRFTELQTMIDDLKLKLAEANAQLGR
jgi:DNA repair exonuclease SbcCD ATPase subunit